MTVTLLTRDPGGILTPNRWSRNPVLYTIELRSHIIQCSISANGRSYGANLLFSTQKYNLLQ